MPDPQNAQRQHNRSGGRTAGAESAVVRQPHYAQDIRLSLLHAGTTPESERGYRALSMLCKELGHSNEAITLCYIGIEAEEIKEICNLSAKDYDWAFAQAIRDELGEE